MLSSHETAAAISHNDHGEHRRASGPVGRARGCGLDATVAGTPRGRAGGRRRGSGNQGSAIGVGVNERTRAGPVPTPLIARTVTR